MIHVFTFLACIGYVYGCVYVYIYRSEVGSGSGSGDGDAGGISNTKDCPACGRRPAKRRATGP
jgi:hypothetical protein